jgi:hypothetical protein
MNPLLKCCGYYCACLAFIGIIMFAILMGIIKNENPYFIKEEG